MIRANFIQSTILPTSRLVLRSYVTRPVVFNSIQPEGDRIKITKDFQLRPVFRNDVEVTFSRSSGPGGQNVNKVNTKVDMRLSIDKADWIPLEVRSAIVQQSGKKVNKEGELVVTSTKYRTQMQNIDDALEKMNEILENAVESIRPREIDPVKKKKLTKQKKKANENRLKDKKMVAMQKAKRKKTDW